MAKKKIKRTPPRFKVGDWVNLSEEGTFLNELVESYGKYCPMEIKKLIYYDQFENNPSPWMVIVERTKDSGMNLWEEHVALDVFMTAIKKATEKEATK